MKDVILWAGAGQIAVTPTEELLNLEVLKPENIKDTLHAYQMAKRCNEKRVMSESVMFPYHKDISGTTYTVAPISANSAASRSAFSRSYFRLI